MDPPSYDEAGQHPRVQGPEVLHISPPPAYNTTVSSPPTPPPAYGEAVDSVPDHFPVLNVPQAQQNTGVFIHPTTQVNGPVPVVVNQPFSTTWSSPAVIYQPQPVAVAPSQLTDSPGQMQCPHCGRTGTTQVTYVPSGTAWCLCTLLVLVGVICGCCLIPLLAKKYQNAHHSCPHCNKVVHIYKR